MVFVWSQLVKGDPNYTLVQVSVNDIVMVFAFAPIAAFLLGVTDIRVPCQTLVRSSVMYVVLPLAARAGRLRRAAEARLGRGLIDTVVLLFGLQAGTPVAQPLVIAMIALPLALQTCGIFALGWAGARLLRLPHEIAGSAYLIGTSNFFELAVAVAISLFGLHCGAALATVVGVLVEVPLMLSLVWLVNRWRPATAR
jgi:ACR3 family arsenite transporter